MSNQMIRSGWDCLIHSNLMLSTIKCNKTRWYHYLEATLHMQTLAAKSR